METLATLPASSALTHSWSARDEVSHGGRAPADAPPSVSPDRLSLESLQRQGLHFICLSGWLMSVLFVFLSLVTSANAWWIIGFGVVLNIWTTWRAKRGPLNSTERIWLTLAIATFPQSLILCFWLNGETLNVMIPHMVTVITLIALYDVRCAVLGSGLCLTSFLAYKFIDRIADLSSPLLWVGTAMEVVGMIFVSVITVSLCSRTGRLLHSLEASRDENARRNAMLEEQAEKLEDTRQKVEFERREREKAEAQQFAARKAEIRRFAEEFEASISVVTQSLSSSACQLDRSTKELNAIAHDTGQNAAEVAVSAKAASKAAGTVAQGVAELSHSISDISTYVSGQNDLTNRATERSQSGGEAVGELISHSKTIGEATRAIVRIAERTNLLSLNAAIEAASAGPAGRGFTIVAQEVKGLAAQASEAATQINAFLNGVQSGTLEAERSFAAIDAAVSELVHAAATIRNDVTRQRKAADAIEDYARSAALDVGNMAERSDALAKTASSAEKLAVDLDKATSTMLRNVRNLEETAAKFVADLKAA